jgi:hypothetical protein
MSREDCKPKDIIPKCEVEYHVQFTLAFHVGMQGCSQIPTTLDMAMFLPTATLAIILQRRNWGDGSASNRPGRMERA